MAPTFDQLRVLLLQIRREPPILQEEQRSFLQRTRLRPAQLHAVNVLEEPLPPSLVDNVDAVLIGGSGAFSVTETHPWTQSLIDLCVECAEKKTPLFGSCWGHQFIARAFGGTVIADHERTEMGTHPVTLTDDGMCDTLFGTLPPQFEAQMGHQDRVVMLPSGGRELAVSDVNPVQAYRLGDLPIYGTQFHTELDETTERQRLLAYRSHYPEMGNDSTFQTILDSVKASPEADDLLHRFLLLFALVDDPEHLAETIP